MNFWTPPCDKYYHGCDKMTILVLMNWGTPMNMVITIYHGKPQDYYIDPRPFGDKRDQR